MVSKLKFLSYNNPDKENMTIELKWLKKTSWQRDEKWNRFFLALFSLINKSKNAHKIGLADVSNSNRSSLKNSATNKYPNLPGAFGSIEFPVLSLINWVSKHLNKMKFDKKQEGVFLTLKRSVILPFSLSFVKLPHCQSSETFLVHSIEKNNWLIRSDNNTGYSVKKILQTTFI
jgi:hypothetical protein